MFIDMVDLVIYSPMGPKLKTKVKPPKTLYLSAVIHRVLKIFHKHFKIGQ
jgi:hypothetical protein